MIVYESIVGEAFVSHYIARGAREERERRLPLQQVLALAFGQVRPMFDVRICADRWQARIARNTRDFVCVQSCIYQEVDACTIEYERTQFGGGARGRGHGHESRSERYAGVVQGLIDCQ